MSGPGRSAGRVTSIALKLLVVGVIAVVVGVSMSTSTSDGVVECDGEVMGPGDACISTSSQGGTYEDRVETERESAAWNRAHARTVLVAGSVVASGSAIVLLVTLARRPPGRARSGDGGSARGSGSQWW